MYSNLLSLLLTYYHSLLIPNNALRINYYLSVNLSCLLCNVFCCTDNEMLSGELCPSRNSLNTTMPTCDSYIGSLAGVTILGSLVTAASIILNNYTIHREVRFF